MTIAIEILGVIVGVFASALIGLFVWLVKTLHANSEQITLLSSLQKDLHDQLSEKFTGLQCVAHTGMINKLNTEQQLMEQEVTTLKANCSQYKEDMDDIEKNLAIMKSDFQEIKKTVENVKESVESLSATFKHIHNQFKDLLIELAVTKPKPKTKAKIIKKNDRPVKTKNS